MTEIITLDTERLTLRPWREADKPAFAAMNADPEVMRHFPKRLTRDESDGVADRVAARLVERGWGFFAVEVKGGEPFIGFVGLNEPAYALPCGPCVEIGWRLSPAAWGRGYATEAARAALDFGFGRLQLPEIVSFTAVANDRSRRVMERLGMVRDPDGDFDHPLIEAGNPVRRHVFYRLDARSWSGA